MPSAFYLIIEYKSRMGQAIYCTGRSRLGSVGLYSRARTLHRTICIGIACSDNGPVTCRIIVAIE